MFCPHTTNHPLSQNYLPLYLCFPYFTLSLSDPHLLKALTLNIHTSGEFINLLDGAQSIALIYCIYYKCIKTNLNVYVLVKSPKDKTLLIQGSTTDINIEVSKTILWKDITLLEKWLTVNENYSYKNQYDSNDLHHIQQYDDGSIQISFDRLSCNQSSRHSICSQPNEEDEIFSTPLCYPKSNLRGG